MSQRLSEELKRALHFKRLELENLEGIALLTQTGAHPCTCLGCRCTTEETCQWKSEIGLCPCCVKVIKTINGRIILNRLHTGGH